MKKIFTILLALSLILSMAACGFIDEPAVQPNEVTTADTTAPLMPNTEITTEAPEEIPETTVATTEEAFKNIVLYDDNGIVITCKGFVVPDTWSFGPSLKILVENNSDVNVTVSVEDCSINGYMIDPFFATDCAAGKKVNAEITWFNSDFEENEITQLENIEFYFHIYNADTWDTIADSTITTLNFN